MTFWKRQNSGDCKKISGCQEGWGVMHRWSTEKFLFCLFVFFNLFIYVYFWLCWVFVSVRGLSLVAASGGHSSSRCTGLSLSRPLLLQSTGSRHAGSVVVAHGPSCSAACGILPDQGSNPCPLHWQADSQPLHHQGSPGWMIFEKAKSHVLIEGAYCPAGEERPSWWREDFRQGWMDE